MNQPDDKSKQGKINLKDYVVSEMNKHRGIWPWISGQAGVSYSYTCKIMRGGGKKLYYESLQKLFDTLIEINNGEIIIPDSEVEKMKSNLGNI